MELFSTITKLFNANIIYQKTYIVFTQYMFLIPVFFAVALGFRLLEEGANNIGGKANYHKAFQDAFTTALFIFSYGAIAIVFCKFIIAINNYVGDQGAFSIILDQYNGIIKDLKEAGSTNSKPLGSQILNIIGMPVEMVAGACFSLTFAMLMFVHLFLRFAYAIIFCFLFTWGGIAIATSPSQILSLKSGFISTLKGLIIWPIIESIFYFLTSLMLSQAGTYLTESTTYATSTGDMSFAYFIFSFTNIFLIAVIVAAAAVANFLSQNQSAMSGVTSPFMAAGLGVGALIGSQMKKGGGIGVKKTGSSYFNVGAGLSDSAKRAAAKTGTGIGNIITGALKRNN